ncbi:aminoglycoside phosphotransferase family protein [Crocosphaera chwakensis]|uniref:Aminoglycoside phosphotransferase domain-containing protein n=1 Tax=Crocosphaera chwakensis CCY0110 TaxID=391612 RepID=A3IGR9_9CHRO|nr:aminoglycoside phosphotransferase family protein [Crocosphaera chwakensis]EAZ94161.1 hypothetical protein CY0110_09812 [Crocosphaera chwakensis CCY0110]
MKFFKVWQCHFYLLLLHPTQAMIWVKSHRNQDYCLPQIKINQGIRPDNVTVINQAIEQKFGITVNILHYAYFHRNQTEKVMEGVYVLELDTFPENMNNGMWCDRITLNRISFPNLEHKSLIQTYLMERQTGKIPELRPPWAQLGWYAQVSNWIKKELSRLGYEQIAPIECVKSWCLSCILKVPTTVGFLYFKQASTLPLFCHEPIITKELATFFPNYIPKVISINPEQHWLLLEDFGQPIGNQVSLKIKQNIYGLLAKIQIQSVKYCDRLLAMGCLDRRLQCLETQIEPLIENAATLTQLSAQEITQLHNLVPVLKNLCLQLDSYNIPSTLVHGDLHLNNVAFNKGNYIFFDWTDSCISHPFFDLFELFFISSSKFCLNQFKTFWNHYYSIPRIRNSYLSQWLEYESKERLLEAWAIARPLCALHHAITYQYIINILEPKNKWEFSNVLPFFLRKIIQSAS